MSNLTKKEEVFLAGKKSFINDVYKLNTFPYASAHLYYKEKHEELKLKVPLLEFEEFKYALAECFFSGIHPISLQEILPLLDYTKIVSILKVYYSITAVTDSEGNELYVF